MNMISQTGRTVLTVSSAVAMLLAAAAAGAQESTPASLGQVIVTAQKRAEALADIPMSISVLSGEALERQQADNFQDLVSMVPGLSINSSTRGVTRVSMRGINTGGVASTVGVYVNEVPFGSSSGLANAAVLSGDFDTFDMARIEVLRGPQGTLYGASSLGGVIKYVANEPSTDDFEARFQGSMEDVTAPTWATRGRRCEHPDKRHLRPARERLLPFRRRLHRVDRQQPNPGPAGSVREHRRRDSGR
jgi:outer membrane receptor protein involved in Fe transport